MLRDVNFAKKATKPLNVKKCEIHIFSKKIKFKVQKHQNFIEK